MTEKHHAEQKKESTGLALSGMILSIIGLAGVFLPAWKLFALICASLGLVVSIYSFYRTKKVGAKTGRAIAGIFLAVLTLYIALMIVVLKRVDSPTTASPVPAEPKDSSALQVDQSKALEKLNQITDSSTTK
ncbi:MAG: hypothetical protein PSX36_13525 [bacterium]|nr:hypothetical protein [bacterium]